ncbi:hypothetical protein [Reichenbachiella ulvae]|uniref:Uncharacterized protein n=1 Tax=Reichenbachiella ulvae TaxID=2980104 RepID=A0ABT3CZB9_9BACT|nr:hypothetical protein [Reichenbachiella ulvae]MCV9389051.1 hypothetical protein [Reichenbachiella ulvae]
MDIDFIKAWELWFQGVGLTNYRLFGVSIFWLGRIGKIIQFLGGLMVIFEIIGFTRLSKFSANLKELINFRNIRQIAFFGLENTRKWYQKTTSKKLTKEEKDVLKIDSSYTLMLIIAALISALYCSVKLAEYMNWFWAIFLGSFAFSFSGLIIPVIISLFALLFYCISYALNFFLISPIVWVLDKKSLNSIVKVIALMSVIVGTIFDLLAS